MHTPKIDKQEAYIMRKLGWSCADIAYYYGCSTQAVQNATGKVKTDRNALCDFWNKYKFYVKRQADNEIIVEDFLPEWYRLGEQYSKETQEAKKAKENKDAGSTTITTGE
jgi:predicted DNA-binding protein YlxM (UPF0122 family)